jgi:hypothetical protein
LGGLQHQAADRRASGAHPAGALDMHMQREREFKGSFAVEGFNPAVGPTRSSMPLPAHLGIDAGRPGRPVGLSLSASAGALLLGGSSPVGSSLGPGYSPIGVVSAMSMDARGRDRSADSHSPPPVPVRRRLIEVNSAPRLGDELPPLHGSPASTFGPRGLRTPQGAGLGLVRPSMRHPESSWKDPRMKKVDAVLLGKGSHGDNGATGIDGWTLSGHSPDGSSP